VVDEIPGRAGRPTGPPVGWPPATA